MNALFFTLLLSSPLDQLGFCAAGSGVASAAVGEPSGAGAAFYNPARVAAQEEADAVVGYSYSWMRFSLNGIDQELDAARATCLALSIPVSLGEYGSIGGSVAMSVPDERLIRARVTPTDRPRFMMYDNRLQRLAVEAALSYATAIGPVRAGIAGGASILAGAAGNGTTFQLTQNNGYERADAWVQSELPLRAAPSAAAFVSVGDWSAGLTVRGPIEFEMAVGLLAQTDFGVLSGDIYSEIAATDFYTPLKAALGLSWHHEYLALHAALELHRWSVAPPLTGSWATDVEVAGLPVEIPSARPAPQELCDVWIPRLGAEHRFELGSAQLSLRAGAFYEPTPLERRAAPVLVDSDRVGASIGLGLNLPVPFLRHPLSLDLHMLWILLEQRTFASDSPVAIHPDVRISGHLISTGASLTLRFG